MLRPAFFTLVLLTLCAPALAQKSNDWHKPEVACALLDDLGLKTRGYKNDPSAPNEYFCSAPYTQIDKKVPFDVVFIAYYVDGTRENAKQLKAVVSIHDRSAVGVGSAALALAGEVLTRRALGFELPDEIANAIEGAEARKFRVGGNQIEVQREDYINGWGYDLKFVIR